MTTTTTDTGDGTVDEVALVDPRAPRFGQAITASGLAAGVALDAPVLVYAVTAILLAAVLSRWQFDPYGLVWRHVALRLVDPPAEREPAAPHRFAKLVGAVGTTAASAAILAGAPLVGAALALAVAAAAGLAAATGICIGCRLYAQVSFLRRLSIV